MRQGTVVCVPSAWICVGSATSWVRESGTLEAESRKSCLSSLVTGSICSQHPEHHVRPPTPEGHEGALLSTVQLSPAFSSLCQGARDITVPPHGPVCSLRATEDFRPPTPRAIEWPSPAPPEFTTHNTRCRNKMIVFGSCDVGALCYTAVDNGTPRCDHFY